MVARLLNLCGLNLGPEERLMGPNANNPMGHFEHTGFLEIDDALLKHFGGSWDDPPLLNSGWETDPALQDLAEQAKKLITTFSGSRHWGWKEPRTTLLLPFWQKLIPNLRFVICIRSPLEVAKSLANRDGIAIEKGINLWTRYMYAAIRDTKGCPAFFTFYDDYFRHGEAETHKLLDFCGLPRPENSPAIQNVIAHELRHHANELVDLLSDQRIPTEDKLLYVGLRSFAYEITDSAESKSELSAKISVLSELIEELRERRESRSCKFS